MERERRWSGTLEDTVPLFSVLVYVDLGRMSYTIGMEEEH